MDFALQFYIGDADGSPELSQHRGGSLYMVQGPPCSELLLSCVLQRSAGDLVVCVFVRAPVALELGSEYVISAIFRVSMKHGKWFKRCVWMCCFLSTNKLAACIAKCWNFSLPHF